MLALRQSCLSHLSTHNNYLWQLDNVRTDRIKYILKFIYDRNEGLHPFRYKRRPVKLATFSLVDTETKSFNVPQLKLLVTLWLKKTGFTRRVESWELKSNPVAIEGLQKAASVFMNYISLRLRRTTKIAICLRTSHPGDDQNIYAKG